MIFLVITAEGGSAIATFRVRVPLFLTTRRMASATSSNFSTLPSVIQPRSRGSMAQRSSTRLPSLSRPSSTSLTLEELMSKPSSGAGWRLNNDPKEIKFRLLKRRFQGVTNLRFHFNASSNILVTQRIFPISDLLDRCQKPTRNAAIL